MAEVVDMVVKETLAAIDAPHFLAGIVLRGDKVAVAPDVVRYMRGWKAGQRAGLLPADTYAARVMGS